MEKCELSLPEGITLDQDEEWIWVSENGSEKRRIRLHNYGAIYDIPGLYEKLFCSTLKSRSWEVIPSMLSYALNKSNGTDTLRVLDFGAGNGMVGEAISTQIDCELMVGIDILSEAKKATERDRPGVYDKYYVLDMSQLDSPIRKELQGYDFNCLVTVAALGFGDIPTKAFVEAFNLVRNQGWIGFNIKDVFLTERDDTGFAKLLRRMLNDDILESHFEQKYRHRFSIDGRELYYNAVIGKKKRNIEFADFNL